MSKKESSTSKVKPQLLLFFAVPENANLEDRRYSYRKHLREHGIEDENAVICERTRGKTTYLYVQALEPFLTVLKYLPYRLKEAKKDDRQLTLVFQDYDFYNLSTVKVQDRDSVPARLLEALVYFAFDDYGVKTFTAKPNGDVEIIMQEYYTDYSSGYQTNGAGYVMITAMLGGLDENKYWLESAFKDFRRRQKPTRRIRRTHESTVEE
jgi:hypothetical protein